MSVKFVGEASEWSGGQREEVAREGDWLAVKAASRRLRLAAEGDLEAEAWERVLGWKRGANHAPLTGVARGADGDDR